MAPKRQFPEPLSDQETQPKRRRIGLSSSTLHSEPIQSISCPLAVDYIFVPKLICLTVMDSSDQHRTASSASNPTPLTKENLRLLEEMTGLKSTSDPKVATTPSKEETASKAKTTSTTRKDFEEKLRGNGVVHPLDSSFYPPANETELLELLDKSRTSASPTASQYEDYVDTYKLAACEADMVHVFSTQVLKEPSRQLRKEGYYGSRDKQWVDIPKDLGFNNGLSAPKPDYIEGCRRGRLPPTVLEFGGAATFVKDLPQYVALPHLAMKLKHKGADMDLAGRQAGYDGAAMVYARNKALNLMGQQDVHDKAAVVTATTDGLAYNIFGHYTSVNGDTRQLQYHQGILKSGTLGGIGNFKDGYKRMRNMQDFAYEQSTDVRDRLAKDYESRQFGSSRPSQSVAGKSTGGRSNAVDTEGKNSLPDPSSRAPAPSNASSGSRQGQPPSGSSNNSTSKGDVGNSSGAGSKQQSPSARPSQVPKPPLSAASGDSNELRDRYRDRRSYRDTDGIQPLQHRQSDSPHDKPRVRQVDRRTLARPDTAGSNYSRDSRFSAQSRSRDGVRSSATTASKVSNQNGPLPSVGAK